MVIQLSIENSIHDDTELYYDGSEKLATIFTVDGGIIHFFKSNNCKQGYKQVLLLILMLLSIAKK